MWQVVIRQMLATLRQHRVREGVSLRVPTDESRDVDHPVVHRSTLGTPWNLTHERIKNSVCVAYPIRQVVYPCALAKVDASGAGQGSKARGCRGEQGALVAGHPIRIGLIRQLYESIRQRVEQVL